MKRLKRFVRSLSALCAATFFAGVVFAADVPLAGHIWSVREARFISVEELVGEVIRAEIVLLGETHDNPLHHELQLLLLQEIVLHSGRPALVMEQFDREFQEAITEAERHPDANAESVFKAGHFNRNGWRAEYYQPMVALALEYKLPIIAGNVSRDDARVIIRDPTSIMLPEVSPDIERTLAKDILGNHGGVGMTPEIVVGMVKAQRARDFVMAKTLERYADRGAVLIAGIGHVRRDRGVPLYLDPPALVIGFIDVDPTRTKPLEYLDGKFLSGDSVDYIWFTNAEIRAE